MCEVKVEVKEVSVMCGECSGTMVKEERFNGGYKYVCSDCGRTIFPSVDYPYINLKESQLHGRVVL